MKTRFLFASLLIGAGSLSPTQGASAADFTIKFAHNSPPRMDAQYHRYFVTFEKLATKYTNGKIAFQEFPASQMGSDQRAAKKLQLGLIQMMALATNNLAQLYSGFDLFTLPYLITDMGCGIHHVLNDSKLLHEISEIAQKKANIRLLALEGDGPRNMMNSKHPIVTPADLDGLRMRVAKNPIQLDFYKALGADVVGIASAETYGALQTGIVDGNDGGVGWIYAQKLYEVQKYYSLTRHQMVVSAIIINDSFFNALPKDVQAGLQKAALQAAQDNTQWMKGYIDNIYAKFKKAGIKFNSPDRMPFREVGKKIWKKYAQRVGGMDRIEYVQDLQKSCK
ncbi:MAG TPA: TRAP transporter substrate-binding protein [Pseudolabrys sp.]|nr:TRAP transporter substrate-binding protein [Pseudolabrys sp.]